MTAREPITILALLALANPKGEIGYAYGGANEDLQTVEKARDLGLIRYGYDASQDRMIYGKDAQQRSVYFITEAGKTVKREGKEPDAG